MSNACIVPKTCRVCSFTNILDQQRLLLLSLERRALITEINADLRCKNTSICLSELQVVSGTMSLPRFR